MAHFVVSQADGSRGFVPAGGRTPHHARHSKLSALLEAYIGDDWDAACDMLTRTSETDDIAPDASIFPRVRDPETGGRRLEELAFEGVSTDRLSRAAVRAQKLIRRGVRRVFAIDVPRERTFEWSPQLGTWEILAPESCIEDPVFVAPVSVTTLCHVAKIDDAVAQALLAKRNPVIESALARTRAEGQAEGEAQALLSVLAARGLQPTEEQRQRITAERNAARLDRWLRDAVTCSCVSELFQTSDD